MTPQPCKTKGMGSRHPLTEQERLEVEEVMAKYTQEIAQMPLEPLTTFINLYPLSEHKAIQQQSALGFKSFKIAKQTSPLKGFVFKKFQRFQNPV